VIGAIAGIALIAAALFFARRASQKKRAANMGNMTSQPVAELPHSSAPHELPPTVKYAHVAEAPGAQPIELHGDVPSHK
jgi:hypothetical protein